MDVRPRDTERRSPHRTAAVLLAVLLTAWSIASASAARGAGEADGTAAPWAVTLELSAADVTVGTAVTYSGTVRTAEGQPGAGTVTVQKRRAAGGDWIQWRTADLDEDGRYAVTVDMVNRQTWEFRARMPGDGGANATGYSAIAGLTVGPAAGGFGPGEYAFTITGRGWGHGIGMSQWGAYGLARHGRGYKAILRHYYTGVGFAKVRNRTVRVLLRRGVSAVRLTCANRYTVAGGAGPFTLAGGTTATVTRAGSGYRVVAGSFNRVFASAPTFKPAKGRLDVRTPTDLGQVGKHRGRIHVVASGGSLMMVNLVALESYLRAVVPHEVPASWPAAALRAQACAARAYAESARRSSTGRQWDLYCDVRSQAYGGVAWEKSRTDAAVKATAGVVPVYGGRPIQAFYFSCSGGHTENVEYAWQTSAVPYLKGVNDPYDSSAPLHTWGPLRRTPAQLQKALGGVKGTLQAIYRVKAGASPRIVKAAIIGSGGTTYLHGGTLRSKLGLNSAWATFWSMSVRPSAAERLVVSVGEKVTISGCIYPALPSGATVTLRYGASGAWRSRRVQTQRHVRRMDGGSVARYSTFRVAVAPTQATQYFFEKGAARSPKTTIRVR